MPFSLRTIFNFFYTLFAAYFVFYIIHYIFTP